MSTLKRKLSSLHKSFTNWFNVTGIVILQVLSEYPEVTTYLTNKDLLILVILGNIVLRVFKTNKAIEAK